MRIQSDIEFLYLLNTILNLKVHAEKLNLGEYVSARPCQIDDVRLKIHTVLILFHLFV